MRKSRFHEIDPVTKSAGAALLCSILAHCLSDRQSELYACSEALSWIVLPILCTTAGVGSRNRRPDLPFDGSTSKKLSAAASSLWTVALSLAAYWVFAAENGMFVFLPASTPLLFVAQKYLWSDLELRTSSPRSAPYLFYFLANTFRGTAFAASFAIVTLKSDWHFQAWDVLSIVPLASLLVIYITLTPRPKTTNRSCRFIPAFDIEDAILPLSLRVTFVFAIVIGLESLAFGFPVCSIASTLALALAKAASWYFVIQTSRQSSWRTVAAMETFSLMSTRDPFTLLSDARALSHVMASFLSLGQVITMLPKQAKAKSALWVLSLVSLAPYLANLLAIKLAGSSSSLIHPEEHHVQVLIQNAKADFETLLQKQSKSYTAAHDEYQRRYGLEPPPGFEAWYEFARSQQSPIIDDFDVIFKGVSPFWRLSGKEVLEIMSRMHDAPNSELWLCEFSGYKAKTHCSHSYRSYDRHIQSLLDGLFGGFHGLLPNVKFLVNHIDEPRVLIPPPSGGDTNSNGLYTLTEMSRRPIWDTLTKFCDSREEGRPADRTRRTQEICALPFVNDSLSAMDLCQHPEYSSMHGLAMSPTSFRLIEGLVPVLSTGSPSTMGDILYPSPAYTEAEFQYTDAHDVAWDKKRNNLHWAGSTTGGFASDDQWRHFHRQRFVELAQNLEKRQHCYLRERGGVLSHVKSSFLNGRLFDVAFARIFQCERRHCRDQRAYFNLKSWEDKDRALESRLVFDMDGNGISGRYYKFLASRSVPLKQTMLREWHDERLVPWFHYIPVSQSMEELPELVFHLTSTEAGQRAAREIAEQGRNWFSKAFRDVDRTIYMYRLLLELARLQDPKRKAHADARR
ncbi:uncharacterized protein BCR38DRAFT_351634 [Pseudomassariella vexata]|uniref:Glycosyl transferase CAP10 domain-containing protein n=1 Tax=Pseudomassariella vexata TaxID=1141098 RepID=A0A1Y2DK63_9PEZI|nr:uncharacterized protein BCR38DRAFT_351634 [Pseudomassariella vexata]ORY59155.1 hypothetical protein BCR38DRAFT_351634 [Pseudomassariella vexata]